jgi:predicted ATPase
MIERIWVKNFRMLRSNRVDLSNFAILVGKNATGKTTLLLALEFVSNLVRFGVDDAVRLALGGSGGPLQELCFAGGGPLEIAVQVRVSTGRYVYEVAVGETEIGPAIVRERLTVVNTTTLLPSSDTLPALPDFTGAKKVEKTDDGRDWYDGNGQVFHFRVGRKFTSLGHVPEDAELFAGAIAVRNFLRAGVRLISLEGRLLREPSPGRASRVLAADGANLAAVAFALREREPAAYAQWVGHVGTAVDHLEAVDVWRRPEDGAYVLRARFAGREAWVPSYLLSEGTLRLLALTLLAYAEDESEGGLVLIEEPENGLHPLAIQCVYDSLRSFFVTQALVTTHSMVFLAAANLSDALMFTRTDDGASVIRRGEEVAEARQWQSEVRLATVFGAGILG